VPACKEQQQQQQQQQSRQALSVTCAGGMPVSCYFPAQLADVEVFMRSIKDDGLNARTTSQVAVD
jgi:hypothetical protein